MSDAPSRTLTLPFCHLWCLLFIFLSSFYTSFPSPHPLLAFFLLFIPPPPHLLCVSIYSLALHFFSSPCISTAFLPLYYFLFLSPSSYRDVPSFPITYICHWNYASKLRPSPFTQTFHLSLSSKRVCVCVFCDICRLSAVVLVHVQIKLRLTAFLCLSSYIFHPPSCFFTLFLFPTSEASHWLGSVCVFMASALENSHDHKTLVCIWSKDQQRDLKRSEPKIANRIWENQIWKRDGNIKRRTDGESKSYSSLPHNCI